MPPRPVTETLQSREMAHYVTRINWFRAYDQPDVYETSDLPEADQANLEIQEENENIERIHLDAGDAYNKFKGKTLDASHTDFSDRIIPRQRMGYNVFSGDYEMMGSDLKEPETPLQKYHRLQHELRELTEEVEEIKMKTKNETEEKKNTVELAKQAEELRNQLSNFKLEQALGTEILKNLNDPEGSLQKKLLMELEHFKEGQATTSSSLKATKDECGDGKVPDHVVYELHYRPEVAKFKDSAKITDMEHRMQKLESVIGGETDKLASLASDTNHQSILGAISIMNSKLNLLDPAHIDQVDAHLAALSLRLSQLADKRAIVEDAEKLSKVSELYDLLKKTEVLCAELPDIVNRMVILKDLHEQALQFSTALSQLDVTQQQINNSLKSNQDVLNVVQKEFAKNMDVIKGNVGSLEKRMSSLKK